MLSSILTPLIQEVLGLRDFIYERIGRDKIDQMEHLGYYDFDDLSLQRQLKIKLPCVMQLYSEIIASTSGVEAAKELRLRCAIWRESMRKFWPAFGSSQVMNEFSKSIGEWSKSINEWSKSAPDFEGKQVTATLKLSQIIGIKLLKAGNDHFDEILHRVPFYRLSLDSVIDKPDKYDACIAQLGFQHVREVNKKIFDLPAEYHDFNKMRTPELCTTMISLMTGMLQLAGEHGGHDCHAEGARSSHSFLFSLCSTLESLILKRLRPQGHVIVGRQ